MSFFPSLLSTLLPPLCVHCRREGFWLCPEAEQQLATVTLLRDPVTIPGIDQVFCLGSYDEEILASIVKRLKYSGWYGLQEYLPQVLQPLKEFCPADAVLIPLPLHPRRKRERGFNQAEVIAKALTKVTGLPVSNVLIRKRFTKQQAKLSEEERTRNVQDAFQLNPKTPSLPKIGVLIDDVITTGSTLGAAARVLREAGVEVVAAVALGKG